MRIRGSFCRICPDFSQVRIHQHAGSDFPDGRDRLGRAELDKLSADMQATYSAMVEELRTKYATYNQMSANWTPSVLATKEQELQDLESRLQQYQQNAQMDLTNLQNQLMAPIQQKATEAVNKIAKANGLGRGFRAVCDAIY